MLFILVLVQLGFLLAGRHAAQAAGDAGARRLAAGWAEHEVTRSVTETIIATVPGAEDLRVVPTLHDGVARITATYRWTPPGPYLVPVTVRVRSEWNQVPQP